MIRWLPILAVGLLACTPIGRHQALVAVGAAGCGTGNVAVAAGESWGALVRVAGCWLADWAAERLDRLRQAERMDGDVGRAATARLDRTDAAAVELAEARSLLLADPCEANAALVSEALVECQRLRGEAVRP